MSTVNRRLETTHREQRRPNTTSRTPDNHRPTRTETSARIAFTNLLTAYIATTEQLSQLLHNLTSHT